MTLIFVSHDAALEPLFDRTVRLAEINRARGRQGSTAEHGESVVSGRSD
jgi:putative ABC transport system ATP-binding protein